MPIVSVNLNRKDEQMSFNESRRFASIEQLLEIEKDPASHWRTTALSYWRRYLANLVVIRELRRQNRALRNFLSDIVPPELASGFLQYLDTPKPAQTDPESPPST